MLSWENLTIDIDNMQPDRKLTRRISAMKALNENPFDTYSPIKFTPFSTDGTTGGPACAGL
jgi:hypothetical protein